MTPFLTFGLLLVNMTIKFATIAPEGTFWHKTALQLKNSVEKGEKIRMIIYLGASMGDEVDIVRKLRIGQIHGAAITSHGAEVISPEIRAFDTPGVFRSYEEFFTIREKLFPELQRAFYEKGYILLSHFAIGFVYIFSRKENPLGTNLWVWTGDILAEAQAKEMSAAFRIIPLQITDVLQALATGMVESVLNAFYALQSLQWGGFIKSYIPEPLYLYTGVVIVRKDIWDKIPIAQEEKQKGAKDIYKSMLDIEREIIKLNEQVEKDIRGSVKVIQDEKVIEKIKELNERVKRRILDEKPEIRRFHSLIEKELAELRRERSTR